MPYGPLLTRQYGPNPKGSKLTIQEMDDNLLYLSSSIQSAGSPFPFVGDAEITGSLNVTNGITSSLYGTASWAENAQTASYVEMAQTSSYALTSSIALNFNTSSIDSALSIETSDRIDGDTSIMTELSTEISSLAEADDTTIELDVITNTIRLKQSIAAPDFGARAFQSDVEVTGSLGVTGSINGLNLGIGAGNYSNNIVLGSTGLNSNTTGQFNIALGSGTLNANTDGSNNIALGQDALTANTIGFNNIALLGLNANTAGNNNIALLGLNNNTSGSYNVALGNSALYSNTTGNSNVAIGKYNLYSNTTGNYNTAVGYHLLRNNSTGNYNVGLGYRSLFSNTSGSHNIAQGYKALYQNTEGNNNIALGNNALNQNTTGTSNIALGFLTLNSNTIGYNNVALGANSLNQNISGNNNVALGIGALEYNTTGSNNTGLGYNVQSGDFSNSIILGSYAAATANNQFVIGSSTFPVGPVTTENKTSNRTLQVNLNGNTYKFLMYKA